MSLTFLSVLDVEAENNDILRQEVQKLLRVVLPDQAFDSEKHNSWVHCGRTKVFLTQSMVSHFYT